MPLDDIRLVITAPDPATGNRALLRHLERMQRELEQTQRTVTSLQEVLSGQLDAAGQVEIRHLASVDVLTESVRVGFEECSEWLSDTLRRLHHEASSSGLTVSGADGALYTDEFFEAGPGEVTAFVPVAGGAGGAVVTLPACTMAVLAHEGAFEDLDRTYGALGSIVAERGIAGGGRSASTTSPSRAPRSAGPSPPPTPVSQALTASTKPQASAVSASMARPDSPSQAVR